ncbi:MAG: addiction module protein [Nitrospirota bacterium]
MARQVEKIKQEIRPLSTAEKAKLLRLLIAELDAPADTDVESAWLEEARRRHWEFVEGKAHGIPGGRVFENIRARLRRQAMNPRG